MTRKRTPKNAPLAAKTALTAATMRVLLLDDEEHYRDTMAGCLVKLGIPRENVITGADGLQGQNHIEDATDAKAPFDLLVTDNLMRLEHDPAEYYTGLELIQYLDGRPDAPRIIMVSSDNYLDRNYMAEDLERDFAARFVLKKHMFRELPATVQKLFPDVTFVTR